MQDIIVGLMRYNKIEEYAKFEKFMFECFKRNIYTFDTADIYTKGQSEAVLGLFLTNHPQLRSKVKIISKAGIIPGNESKVGHLDLSYDHIVRSVKGSIKRLTTTYLDLFLIHRPSPFVDYKDLARAINYLITNKLILEFGVSNFYPAQIDALQKALNEYNIKIVANQIEVNAFCLEHFKNFNLDYAQEHDIEVLAWSPLGGLYNILDKQDDPKYKDTCATIDSLAIKYETTNIHILYAFINNYPVPIKVITGTTDYLKLDTAIEAKQIKLSLADWFAIYVATQGYPMP